MKEKERLDCIVQTRITRTQKDKIDELGVSLREIIDYYIVHNTNPTLELKNRQARLLREIHDMENDLSDKEKELNEVNIKLGVSIDEKTATLEVSTIGERIKSNCQSHNGGKCDKSALGNYIQSESGKTILKKGLLEFNIRDNEKRKKFIEDVFKYLSIADVDFGKNFEI